MTAQDLAAMGYVSITFAGVFVTVGILANKKVLSLIGIILLGLGLYLAFLTGSIQ